MEASLIEADLQREQPRVAEGDRGRISLSNELTGEVWNFGGGESLYRLDGREGFFTLNKFRPGFYTIENETKEEVNVALFNRIYKVGAGTRWELVAHRELESTSMAGRVKKQ
jgi:hypothetical protein